MRRIFIPPNGLQGFAQQSVATQALVRRPAATQKRKAKATTASKPSFPARKKRTKRVTRRAARRTTTKKKPQRLVKGSAAAKRYMAKIRRMRKR